MRQMCGEHVNHVTSSSEAGIRPAHLPHPVVGFLCLAAATGVALWNLQHHFERGDIACLMCDQVSVSRISVTRHFALRMMPMGRNTMKEDAMRAHQGLHVERGSTTSCSDEKLRTSLRPIAEAR